MIRGVIAFAIALSILVMPEWIGGYVANGCQYIDARMTGGPSQIVRECYPQGAQAPLQSVPLVTYAQAHGITSDSPVCYDCIDPATLDSYDARRELFPTK